MNEEIDDFANDKEIQRLRKIRQEHDELIEECMAILIKEFSLEAALCTDIQSFFIYKSIESPEVIESFKSSTGHFDLEIYQVEYNWSSRVGRTNSSGTEQCFLGLLTLRKQYPHTCVFKETLQTIITDWFNNQDVDFREQKKFSRRFHVISQDRQKLEILLFNRPLDELAGFPEMEVELKDNQCLFKISGNPMSLNETKQFIHLAKKLPAILS